MDDAYSEIVGTIIILAIFSISVSIIIGSGYPIIETAREHATIQRIQQGFAMLDARLSKAAFEDTKQAVRMDLGDGSLSVANDSYLGVEAEWNGKIDVYIINPDGSEVHTSSINTKIERVGERKYRLEFEDLIYVGDYDYNDVVAEVFPLNGETMLRIKEVNAGYHHRIKARIIQNGEIKSDVLLWEDSHLAVGQTKSIGCALLEMDVMPPNGISGTYFNNPSFRGGFYLRNDNSIDFDFPGKPHPEIGKDNFSIRWKGEFYAENDEDYEFCIVTDVDSGRVKLWIGEEKIIDGRKTGEICGSRELERGWHGLKLEYTERRGEAKVKLYYESQSIPYQIVPNERLRQEIFGSPLLPCLINTDRIEIPLGKIQYKIGERTIAYEGGGIFSDGWMISPPELHYDGITLSLPLISIQGDSSISGGTANIIMEGSGWNQHLPSRWKNPLDGDTLKILVNSEFQDRWVRYLEELTEDGEFTILPLNQRSNFPPSILFKGFSSQLDPSSFHFTFTGVTPCFQVDFRAPEPYSETHATPSPALHIKIMKSHGCGKKGISIHVNYGNEYKREGFRAKKCAIEDGKLEVDMLEELPTRYFSPDASWTWDKTYREGEKGPSLREVTLHYIKELVHDYGSFYLRYGKIPGDHQKCFDELKSWYDVRYEAEGAVSYLYLSENKVRVKIL